jgi:hypothetical protein
MIWKRFLIHTSTNTLSNGGDSACPPGRPCALRWYVYYLLMHHRNRGDAYAAGALAPKSVKKMDPTTPQTRGVIRNNARPPILAQATFEPQNPPFLRRITPPTTNPKLRKGVGGSHPV